MTNNFLQSFFQIFMRLKVNKIHSLSVLIFIIVFLFSLWSHPSFIPKTSPDSWGYINLAKDFNHKISEIRPFFFPLLIKFCMSLSEMYWEQIFLIIQISFHALICILLFHLYVRLKIEKIISFLLTLIIGFNPSLVYYTTYLLADHLLAVLTFLAWFFTIIFIQKYNNNEKINIHLILIGIFSGLAIVTKPQSILGIIPFILAFIFVSNKSTKLIKPIIILLIINFSFHQLWEQYKSYNSTGTSFELLDFIEFPINMTAIRGGLVDYGKGTDLYNLLEERELLETARNLKISLSYTMDDDPDYLQLYKSLKDDWDIKNDKEFAKKILNHAPLELFIYSISNWHAFFTKRCFGPGEGSFPNMPKIIRYFYIVSYSLFYRPLLAILLLVSFAIFWNKRLLALLFSSGGILLYASLSIAILSVHGGEFPRYRVWIEYIMLFCALFPIGILLEYLSKSLYSFFREIINK